MMPLSFKKTHFSKKMLNLYFENKALIICKGFHMEDQVFPASQTVSLQSFE